MTHHALSIQSLRYLGIPHGCRRGRVRVSPASWCRCSMGLARRMGRLVARNSLDSICASPECLMSNRNWMHSHLTASALSIWHDFKVPIPFEICVKLHRKDIAKWGALGTESSNAFVEQPFCETSRAIRLAKPLTVLGGLLIVWKITTFGGMNCKPISIYIYNSKNAKSKAGGCTVYNKLIFSQPETSRTNSDLKGCKQGTLYHANHAHSGDADVVPMSPLSFSKVWAARGFCYLRLAGHLQRLATSSMTQMFFCRTLRLHSQDVHGCPILPHAIRRSWHWHALGLCLPAVAAARDIQNIGSSVGLSTDKIGISRYAKHTD